MASDLPADANSKKMTAGKTYTIDMVSKQIDSYLRLEEASGKQLAEDDDSGGNLNAKLTLASSGRPDDYYCG